MNVAEPASVDEFLERGRDFLLAEEPRNNLILGIASTIASTDLYENVRYWLVERDGAVCAAALRTPPHKVVLAYTEDLDAVAALRAALGDVPGVVGLLPAIDVFGPATTVMTQRVFALEHVAGVPRPQGSPRVADAHDRDLVIRWLEDFTAEAIPEGAPGIDERTVDLRLAGGDRGLLLWEADGVPVSLAGWGGDTPNGTRIGPVYTPPELRGRGYATALVAELSRRILDGGRHFCFLYTDAANPTSNAIYERIGYVEVGESRELLFTG